MDRFENARDTSSQLEAMSDGELMRLLVSSRVQSHGHGRILLPSGAPVFAKRIPLSATELEPQNNGSTRNFFDLPLYYQYRLGSLGFGAWRELEAHRVAHGWVVEGRSPSFPLLHHWRALPMAGYVPTLNEGPWGDSSAIRRRTQAASDAQSSLVLFLEHLPMTLSQWLRQEIDVAEDPAALWTDVEVALEALLEFTKNNGLLHMDTHLENVLTDGTELYLTDFGLALSRSFALSPAEERFFETHGGYDRCTAITGLIHLLITHYDERDPWREPLHELVAGKESEGIRAAPPGVVTYLLRRAPIALEYGAFYRKLGDDKTKAFPTLRLERALNEVRRECRGSEE